MAAQATGSDLHLNIPISQISMRYTPSGLIAPDIAPIVKVNKQSNSYYTFGLEDAYSIVDDLRAPGTRSKTITRSVSSDTYYCLGYGLSDFIPDEDTKNADAPDLLTARASRAEAIKRQLYLNWEYRVQSLVMTTSNVGSYSVVGSAWNVPAGSGNPILDIDAGMNWIQDQTGVKPNSILFGTAAWRSFRRHSATISLIYGNSAVGKARIPSLESVKAIFNVERVLTPNGYYNSGSEGQTASLSKLFDDDVLIYYAPMTPRIDTPSFMYSFRWSPMSNLDMAAYIHPDPERHGESVELLYYQNEKITAANLGFLVTAVNG